MAKEELKIGYIISNRNDINNTKIRNGKMDIKTYVQTVDGLINDAKVVTINSEFTEIEKKFLVKGEFKAEAVKATRITQGYLCSVPERTVRIRVKGEKGFITIKGISNASGAARFEWEKEIPVEEVKALLELAEPGVIDKTRYLVKNTDGVHIWEVDEFYGDNDGLTVAEIELADENEAFDKPEWLGEEVTGDPKYFNSMLMKNPYKNWK